MQQLAGWKSRYLYILSVFDDHLEMICLSVVTALSSMKLAWFGYPKAKKLATFF